MDHVMIDLETLGVTPSAPIIAIGAVRFDPATGVVDEDGAFYERVDWDSACMGRYLDISTIKWWMRQSDEARMEVIDCGRTVKSVLDRLEHWWFEKPGAEFVWGNGACFDISMMEDLYHQQGREFLWKFWNVRDVRTIVHMAEGIVERSEMDKGVAHNAKDDAIHQAKYVSKMWATLTEGFD